MFIGLSIGNIPPAPGSWPGADFPPLPPAGCGRVLEPGPVAPGNLGRPMICFNIPDRETVGPR